LSEATSAPQVHCSGCGARLEHDQEWCVECGTARTELRPPPDWRAPVAIVAVVVSIVVIAGLIALVSLSIQAGG
jgi:predicted amidophosphoribosyltransferase